MAAANRRRPFKVCDSHRTILKGLVAESLSELKQRGSEKINCASSCRVYLEADGTEVDEEEYFSFLGEQTKLMLVEQGDEWTPRNEDSPITAQSGSYNASQETNESLDVDLTDAPEVVASALAHRMRKDPLFFVSFSDEDLDAVISCDTSEIAMVLGREGQEASYYQETCQRELDRRREMKEATELLKLYDKAAKQGYVEVGEPGVKRHKT